MRDPKQKMRFTDAELSLVKGLFAGNDDLLSIIRKVMLQFELSEQEEVTLRGAINEKTFPLIKKFFLPDLDPDAPLFQLADMVIGLDIKELSPDGAWPYIKAKELEMDYIDQQLKVLKGEEVDVKIKLKDLADLRVNKPSREAKYIEVTARNFLLSFVDSNIQQIKFLAGLKEETVEETKARLEKNSNK